ncbi:hypothetical protein D9M68_897720 [compost metagenome]
MLGKQFAQLFTDRFQSPYGPSHKANMLKLVSVDDAKKLTSQAKAGKIFWKETFLGGCTFRGHCEYGGLENIIKCCGGDGGPPCSELLIDKSKEPIIAQLIGNIDERLEQANEGSSYWRSLAAQRRSAENALNVLKS